MILGNPAQRKRWCFFRQLGLAACFFLPDIAGNRISAIMENAGMFDFMNFSTWKLVGKIKLS
ncbi:MAG: hypothetical protein R6V06_05300 [Kiritimatiellia bacterium]